MNWMIARKIVIRLMTVNDILRFAAGQDAGVVDTFRRGRFVNGDDTPRKPRPILAEFHKFSYKHVISSKSSMLQRYSRQVYSSCQMNPHSSNERTHLIGLSIKHSVMTRVWLQLMMLQFSRYWAVTQSVLAMANSIPLTITSHDCRDFNCLKESYKKTPLSEVTVIFAGHCQSEWTHALQSSLEATQALPHCTTRVQHFMIYSFVHNLQYKTLHYILRIIYLSYHHLPFPESPSFVTIHNTT